MSFKSFVKSAGKVLKKVAPIASALLPGIPGTPIPTGIKAIADKFKNVKKSVKKFRDVIGPAGDRTGRGDVPVNDGNGPVSTSPDEGRSIRQVQRSPIQ